VQVDVPPRPPVPPSPTPEGTEVAAPASSGVPATAPAPAPVSAPTPVRGVRRRASTWLVAACVLGVLVLVVGAGVALFGRGGGGEGPSSAPAPAPVGVTQWFAAASGPSCAPSPVAERLAGVVDSVTCRGGGVMSVFAQLASSSAADAYLASLPGRHRAAVVRAWTGASAADRGEVVAYLSAAGPAIAWTYAGQPFVGAGVARTRGVIDAWWLGTGRVIR
jgi:hypothetical protein